MTTRIALLDMYEAQSRLCLEASDKAAQVQASRDSDVALLGQNVPVVLPFKHGQMEVTEGQLLPTFEDSVCLLYTSPSPRD